MNRTPLTRTIFAALLATGGLVALAVSGTLRELSFLIVFGWAIYLARVLREVTVRWDGLAFFFVGLAVLAVLLHGIASWLRREMSEQRAVWRWRSTLLVVGLVMMMFVAGVAMVGVTHQVTWLVSDDAPMLVSALPGGGAGRRLSANNLKMMGIEVHNFHDTYGALPSPQTALPEQSWATRILPFSHLMDEFDSQKPWDHPDNGPMIRKLVPMLLNPGIRPAVLRDANGYGVTHYAGNTDLFDHDAGLSLDDIHDGGGQTLMIGEINAGFPPWAEPRTNRDPALGINRSPAGFGGPAANNGAYFLMADGSVRFVASQIEPAVLDAWGTPNGGEPTDASMFKQ